MRRFKEPTPSMSLKDIIDRDINRERKAKTIAANLTNPDKDRKKYQLGDIDYDFFSEDANLVREHCKKIFSYLEMPIFQELNRSTLRSLNLTLNDLNSLLVGEICGSCREKITSIQEQINDLLDTLDIIHEDAPAHKKNFLSYLKRELQDLIFMIENATTDEM